MFAIPFEMFWISNRVLLLGISRSATVLEIIDRLASHVLILNAAKVDPQVRQLMNEKRARVEMFEAIKICPLVSLRPGAITLW